MKPLTRLSLLPAAALLISCHPSPEPLPRPGSPDAKVVLGFLEAYDHRNLDGMMGFLAEDAVFAGSTGTLTKPQIRAFFQASFRKHPDLRVEVGTLTEIQGTIQATVKVRTDVIWADTWIFELRNHLIHSYRLASGRRS
jgi:hypothetical protein